MRRTYKKRKHKTRRGGMFGRVNTKKTTNQNDIDYARYWKNDGYAIKPKIPYYWPGWTSKLMGEKPRPLSSKIEVEHQPVENYIKNLRSICADSGVCFAFGIEKKRLLSFFKFNTFEYAVPPYGRLGNNSANGVVKEIKYERDGYNAYAVLKTSKNPMADNLAYEYIVGEYINKVSSFFPIFVDTYGLFKYPENVRDEAYRSDDSIVTSDLKPSSIYDPTVCDAPQELSILIQHIKGARTMETMLKDQEFLEQEAIYALFQIYFTLDQIRTEFTHYDLHCENVLIYEPVVGGYIHYHFHKPGLDVSFKSRYMVKIIDYGRSFFYGATSYYDYLCKQGKRCGVCQSGDFKGLWLSREPATEKHMYINGYYKNESNDLRLLDHCRDLLSKNPSQNGTLYYSPENQTGGSKTPPDLQSLFNMLGDNLYSNGLYKGRKENTGLGIYTIQNVNDASRYLIQLMNKKPLNEYNLDKIGDLHVYTNKPMIYEAVSPQNMNG